MTVPPIPLPTPPSTLPPSSFSSSVGTTNLSTTTTATGGLGGGVGTTPTPWSSTSTSIPTPLEPTDLQRIQLQMQSLNHALTNIRVTLATPTTPMEIQTALKTRETKILESLEQMTRLLNQGMHSSLTTSSSLSNPTTIHTGSTQSSIFRVF
ncbi:hypothetical protein HMI54_013327 [Coelomomyces lativittatus]|nr:hypothetical protein HMI54_013327 [Coelomomyces lativittatus]